MIRKLVKQGITVATYNYLSLIGNFLFATLLLRFGQGTAYGQYVYLTSLQSTAAIVLGFGLQIGLVRSQSKSEVFNAGATLYCVALAIVLLLSWLGISATQDFSLEILLIGAVATSVNFQVLLQPIWQWHNLLPIYWRFNFFQAFGRLIPLLIFLISPLSPNTLWSSMAFVSAIVVVAMLIKSDWSWRPQWTVGWRELKRQSSVMLWLSQVAVSFYNRAGILLLPVFGYFAKDVATFGYVFNLLAAVLLLPALFQNVLMRPLFKRELSTDVVFKALLHWYCVAGIIFGWIFGHYLYPVLVWLTGQSHVEWQELLAAFSPTIPLVFVASPLGLCLLSEGWDRARTFGQITAAAVFISAVAYFVPQYGLKGAALATTVSYAVLYICYAVALVQAKSSYGHWRLRLGLFLFLSFIPWI